MKKNLLCAAALAAGLFFTQQEAKAQGAYAKIGMGYNFAMGSEINYQSTTLETTSSFSGSLSRTESYKRVNVNYGKGAVVNGALGYMFNEHFGVELGLGYLMGGKNELKDTYTDNGKISTNESEAHSRMLLLQPSLVVSAGMKGINPYARFGLVAAKGTISAKNTLIEDGDKFESESELRGGWGIGFQGGIGAEFNLSEKMAFFSELTMSNLSYSPNEGEYTKATYNGMDVLGELTTRQKKSEFVDEYSESSNNKPLDFEPAKDPKFNLPFSSVGLGIGIKFKL